MPAEREPPGAELQILTTSQRRADRAARQTGRRMAQIDEKASTSPVMARATGFTPVI